MCYRVLNNYVEAFHKIYLIYRKSHGRPAMKLKDILEFIRDTIYENINPAYLTWINNKLKAKDRIKNKEFNNLNPFHWRIDFGWIIKSGGFDVVIGNPPYLSNKEICKMQKNIYSSLYQLSKKQYDLFTLFIERSFSLLDECKYFGYIIPDAFMDRSNHILLRKFLIQNVQILNILKVKNVFQDPTVSNIILIYKKHRLDNNYSFGIYCVNPIIINVICIGNNTIYKFICFIASICIKSNSSPI